MDTGGRLTFSGPDRLLAAAESGRIGATSACLLSSSTTGYPIPVDPFGQPLAVAVTCVSLWYDRGL